MPPNEESPVYGQLYIVDTSTSLNVRTARDENNELKEEILLSLGNILSHNPYSNVYKKASTMIDNTQSCQDFSIRFIDNIAMDKRTSSTPSADEIAGIFDSSEGEPPGYRHVVVNFKHGGPKLLSVLSPHCDPMIYPLLFPYGESGWDPSLIHNGPRKQKERNKLTMRQYACHRLAVREDFSAVYRRYYLGLSSPSVGSVLFDGFRFYACVSYSLTTIFDDEVIVTVSVFLQMPASYLALLNEQI